MGLICVSVDIFYANAIQQSVAIISLFYCSGRDNHVFDYEAYIPRSIEVLYGMYTTAD